MKVIFKCARTQNVVREYDNIVSVAESIVPSHIGLTTKDERAILHPVEGYIIETEEK